MGSGITYILCMEEMKMSKKSTHQGHCQVCGRLQMLPGGELSLHGYKVKSGYFSGTCHGARYQPFELSCELVKRSIVDAQAALTSLEAFRATLRQPVTDNQCWFHTRQANPRGRDY